MERFESKYVPEPNTGCYLWIAASDKAGYGRFWLGGKLRLAHHVAYELVYGDVDSETIDHWCRTPACVNPSHLCPMSFSENSSRGVEFQRKKTHCPHGHEYTEDNTVWRNGGRECKACRKRRRAAAPSRRKAA